MFIAIYFLAFFIMLYIKNKSELFYFPPITKKYSISVLVPAFNEEKTIASTIEAIFASEYPIKELIVLNDGSKDNTRKVVEKLMKKYSALKLINKEKLWLVIRLKE